MGNIKNISYFRENIYRYRDRINDTCLLAFHILIDRIEKDILSNTKISVIEKRGYAEIGIKSSLDRAVLSNAEHKEYSKNCSNEDFTVISEIVYRYYLKYAITRLRESGFGVYILNYDVDYYGRCGDDYTRVCDLIVDDCFSTSLNISITYSGRLGSTLSSLLDEMRAKYNLDDIEANPVITDAKHNVNDTKTTPVITDNDRLGSSLLDRLLDKMRAKHNVNDIKTNPVITDNELPSNLTSDAGSEIGDKPKIEDKDNERLDVLATTTPDLDYDIEDAKEMYRRRLVERSNSVLKSILDLVMNCISSGKESIDIDTSIVKEELSKLGADISDKVLYEIMCWLSTVLSETYDYKLDIVDSFQKDKIYIINISGWA